jgi:hypothetical protein
MIFYTRAAGRHPSNSRRALRGAILPAVGARIASGYAKTNKAAQ